MGVITGRACAVFSKHLPSANALGGGPDTRGGGVGRRSNAQRGRSAGGGSSDVRDRGSLAGNRNASEGGASGERVRGESVSRAEGPIHS